MKNCKKNSSTKKYIKISPEYKPNLNLFQIPNNEIKILWFDCYKNLSDVIKDISSLNLENFPNIFVIQINLESELPTPFKIKKFFSENVNDFDILKRFNVIFLQVYNETTKLNFFKNRENLYLKLFDKDKASFKKIGGSKFNFWSLFYIKKCLVTDINLNEILLHEDLTIDMLENLKYAIYAQDEVCYRLLNLLGIESKLKNLILTSIVRSKNFDIFLAFFDVLHESQVTYEMMREILSLTDFGDESENIFIFAIKSRNLKVIILILSFYENIKDFFNVDFLKKCFRTCIYEDIFEIFIELKRFKFDDRKSLRNEIDEGENILDEIENFHDNIEAGDFDKVKKFIKKYPNYKVCYKNPKVCAIERAIECRKIKIFCFLRANLFYSDKVEYFKEIIGKLSKEEKEMMKKFNLEYMKSDPNAFIGILTNKCQYDSVSQVKPKEICKMITELCESDKLLPIFKNTADTNIKICFTFESESVHPMDPTRSCKTFGIAYHKDDLIYVGKDETDFDRYGTFTHELMHYLLYLIYDNDCLPYCKDDEEKEKEFKEILKEAVEIYHENETETDPIIRYVYQYPNNKREIELAVRVPQLLSKYLKNEALLTKTRKLFPKLFDFYENFTLSDLKIPNITRILKLNKDFGLLNKISESNFQVLVSVKNLLELKDKKLILISNFPQLTLSSFCSEIRKHSKNKLNIRVKNIFIKSEKFSQEHLKKEFKDLIKTSELERVIIQIDELNEENLKSFDCIGTNIQMVIVTNDSQKTSDEIKINKNRYKFVNIDHDWSELTEDSKQFILNTEIEFQGKIKKYSELFSIEEEIYVGKEIFRFIQSKVFKINSDLDYEENTEIFIPRKIIKVENEFKILEFETLDKFYEERKHDQVVLISDNAGSGKTTILKKIYKDLIEKFPSFLVLFVSLKEHLQSLEDMPEQSFEAFIIKTQNLNKLEAEIYKQKFLNGGVRIFFDGFDEISPVCKEETLHLFKLFMLQSKNQIFVTTRTHFEKELEKLFKTFSFKLKSFDENEQIEFLINYWKDSNQDGTLIKNCAEKLVKKLSRIIWTIKSVIGIPLIIQNLAKIFKEKPKDKSFEIEIENLKVSEIFHQIVIEGNFHNLKEKFPEKCLDNFGAKENLLKILQCLAIKYIFGHEMIDDLQLYYDDEKWTPEEIVRGGIVKIYDGNKKIIFNHETFPEFLASNYSFEIIKRIRNPTQKQIQFLLKILSSCDKKIERIFLNDYLENIEDEQKFRIFQSKKKFHEEIENYFESILRTGEEVLINLTKFFLIILRSNPELHEKFSEYNDDNGRTFYMYLLPKIEDKEDFDFFLKEISKLYGEEVYESFLCKTDKFKTTILHKISKFVRREEILKLYFERFNNEKVKKCLELKDNSRVNALFASASFKNEMSFRCLFKIYCDHFKLEEIMYESGGKYKNLFHYLAVYGSKTVIDIAFEYLKKALSGEELKKYLCKVSTDGENLLILAIKYGHFECFMSFLHIFKDLFSKTEISKLIPKNIHCIRKYLVSLNKKNHSLEQSSQHKRELEYLIENLRFYKSDEEEFRKFLLSKNEKHQNLLFALTFWDQENSFEFFLENVLLKFLEFEEFIYVTDTKGRNLLHILAEHGSEVMINLTLEILEEKLTDTKFVSFLMKESHNNENLLVFAIRNKHFECFKKFLKLIKGKFSCYDISNIFFSEKALKSFIKDVFVKNGNDFEFALKEIKFYIGNEKFKKFLISKDKNGWNALYWSILAPNLYLYPFLKLFKDIFIIYLKLEDFIYETDNQGENLLHFLLYNGTEPELNFVLEKLSKNLSSENFKNFLLIKTKLGVNIFTFSCQNKNFNFFKKKLEIFEENFSSEEILELLILWNVFYHAVEDFKSEEFLKFICEKFRFYISDDEKFKEFLLSKSDGHQCNPLIHAIKCYHKNQICYKYLFEKVYNRLFKLAEFIYETDSRGQNFFHLLVKNNLDSNINFLMKKMQEKEFKNLLGTKSQNGSNIFHFVSSESTFKILAREFSDSELKEFLCEKNQENLFPLHSMTINGNGDFFFYIFSVYEQYFRNIQLKEFLKQQLLNSRGKVLNIIDLVSSSMRCQVENILKKYEIEVL